MRILFCDDETAQHLMLEKIIHNYEEERQEKCELISCVSARQVLFEHEAGYPYDLILLDIEMQEMNGMELAHTIRETDRAVPVVFLTNSREHVLEGYEVQALRYLMKPVDEAEFFRLLDLIAEHREKEKKYILCSRGTEHFKVELNKVVCIEAVGHYVQIHTDTDCYEIKRSLQTIAQEAADACMISPHRSYLVNLNHVDRITRTECVCDNGFTVPVSRNCYKEVNQLFIDFFRKAGL